MDNHAEGYRAEVAAAGDRGDAARLDPVRTLILRCAREMRLTMADLSRAAGKNHAYFHQFVWGGRPRRLPEEVREAIAPLLNLPADMLRPDRAETNNARLPIVLHKTASVEATKPNRPDPGQPMAFPIYRDTDAIVPSAALDWLPRPAGIAPPGPLFGLWITRPGGRLQVGDLALVTEGQPPRPGDSVVVLRDQKIADLGTMQIQAGEDVVIATSLTDQISIDVDDSRVLKVVALVLG